jgi:hypothetical protein
MVEDTSLCFNAYKGLPGEQRTAWTHVSIVEQLYWYMGWFCCFVDKGLPEEQQQQHSG